MNMNPTIAAEIVRRRRAAVAAVLAVIPLIQRQRGSRRRIWSQPWLLRRDEQRSVLSMLFNELGPEDPSNFTNYTRMDEEIWSHLLFLVTPLIEHENTNMREAISPRDRLSVTLRYLATGNSLKDLSFSSRIASNTISLIIPETLRAIIKVLEPKCINLPTTREEWEAIAHRNELLWNFPNCIGSLDGKHVKFRPPRREGSRFRNYKGSNSVVLMALVGPDCQFIFVDIGRNGRMHDSAVFRTSVLGEKLEDGSLDLPPPRTIPGFPHRLPYVIVGDKAFPLKEYLMKPYPERGLSKEKKIYNYRVSRVRRTAENAFGRMANKFRILLTTINLDVEKVELITYCCVLLHNYLLEKKDLNYTQDNIQDTSGNERPDGVSFGVGQNRATNGAITIRDLYCTYFNTVGAVPFQDKAIERGNY